MNVRTALLYRKNLATLIDESVSNLPHPLLYCEHTQLMAGHSQPPAPHTDISDRGHSTTQRASKAVMLRVRLLGQIQV